MLKNLCALNGTSGDESAVREYIISQIKDYCEYSVDPLGSIIAFKKGKREPEKKLLICAHMDEVGFIITSITEDGYLRFSPVGGIDPRIVLDRKVQIGNVYGVIGAKAVHLLTDDEKKSAPDFDTMMIDIGASSKKEAEERVKLGDFAYFCSDYTEFGDGFIKSKALDDRIGCMLIIELIKSDLEYDTWFCFNVQEEVGLRGAACSSYTVNCDRALILEATTAADLDGCRGGKRVCVLGDGPVVSFMDGRTVYSRNLYQSAFETVAENGIKCQTKTAIAGGNDAGAVQSSRGGAEVLAVSLPCRYIHSASSVVKASDIDETRKLLSVLIPKLYK